MNKAGCNFSKNGNRFRFYKITIPILLLCIIVLACYSNSFHNGFVSDDHYIIELNRETLTLKSFINAFTSPDRLHETSDTPYYRPLNRFTYIVDHNFFGLNPVGYHAVNICLHALCAVLLYLALLCLGCGVIPSLGAALLFGVHPVNSEPVNFISGRNNILAAVFVLGSLLAFLRAEQKGGRGGYILSGLLFFLGVLSKETAVMLLPILLFIRIRGGARHQNSNCLLKSDVGFIAPHLAFLAVYILLRFVTLDNSYIHDNIPGLGERLWKLLYIVPKYFLLIVAPYNLEFGHVVPDSYTPILVPLLVGWVAIAAASAYLLKARNDTIALGFVWLVFNFLPISNLVPIPSASIAERYLYLPLIGIVIIVADRLNRLGTRCSVTAATTVFCTLVIIFFGYLTFKRNYDWKDDLAMVSSFVRLDPASASAHFALGYVSSLGGDLATAEREWERSVTLKQSQWDARYYLGGLSLFHDNDGKAETHLLAAARADGGKPAVHYALASLYYRKNRGEEALREYRLFLKSVDLTSFHLVPEVHSRVSELERKNIAAAESRTTVPPEGETAGWRRIVSLSTGTELYYDPSSIKKKGDKVTVSVKYLLGKTDKWWHALRFIRFPLHSVYEVRYIFEIKYPLGLYKTIYFEFRDGNGNVVGACDTERGYLMMYDCPSPGTSIWTLIREVGGKCGVL